MTIDQARREFERGLLKDCAIVPIPMAEGYYIVLTDTAGNELPLIDNHKREPRTFKTVDAAIRVTNNIGFIFVALRFQLH